LYLSQTRARTQFKNLLGNANHYLITILVGLNAVEKRIAIHDAEFHAAWNPQDVRSSARRSRFFALDLALVRIVDAIDCYITWRFRKPTLIQNAEFRKDLDSAQRSVAQRLRAFRSHVPVSASLQLLCTLAIAWRNVRVHSLADAELETDERKKLLENSETIAKCFKGLSASRLIDNFEKAEGPTFKEAASLIAAAQQFVESTDSELIKALDIRQYLKESLGSWLLADRPAGVPAKVYRRLQAQKIWGRKKREVKIKNLLTRFGFSEPTLSLSEHGDSQTHKPIPRDTLDALPEFSVEEAVAFVFD
jgi:hypothetical protein